MKSTAHKRPFCFFIYSKINNQIIWYEFWLIGWNDFLMINYLRFPWKGNEFIYGNIIFTILLMIGVMVRCWLKYQFISFQMFPFLRSRTLINFSLQSSNSPIPSFVSRLQSVSGFPGPASLQRDLVSAPNQSAEISIHNGQIPSSTCRSLPFDSGRTWRAKK